MQASVKENRELYIGGSDIATIMGLNKFKSRFDLLQEKAGLKVDDFAGNKYTDYGNTLEPAIRDYINSINELWGFEQFAEGKHVVEGDVIGLRAHTDGETSDTILEIKTTSEIHETIDGYKRYLVQLLFYMVVAGKDKGILAVYDRPDDMNTTFDELRLQLMPIKREDYAGLINSIKEAVSEFVGDLEELKANPNLSEAEFLPADINQAAKHVAELEDKLKALKDIEKQVKEAKANLYELMQANNVKTFKTYNGYRLTMVEGTPDKEEEHYTFDVERFATEHVKLWKQYSKKEIKVTKGRAGYVKITVPKEAK